VAALWRWRGAWCGSLSSRLDCKCRALILECSRVSFMASHRPIPWRLRALPLCCSPWHCWRVTCLPAEARGSTPLRRCAASSPVLAHGG
jgi:hypothetical protein